MVYNCYFDGSKTPDKRMGMGVYVEADDMTYRASDTREPRAGSTSNVAEYLAVIMLLKLMKNKKKAVINIYGDSKMIVYQLNGSWKINGGEYVGYAKQAQELLAELKKKNEVNIQWIPRIQNKEADKLSKAKCKSATDS